METANYQRDLLSRVATRAMHYIKHGASRHDAFLGAWEDTERPTYTVRYLVKTTYGFDEIKKTFNDRNKAESYQQRLDRTLPDEEVGTLEMTWNNEGQRKLLMQMGAWDAKAEFLYGTH